jgi:hypothetical protein
LQAVVPSSKPVSATEKITLRTMGLVPLIAWLSRGASRSQSVPASGKVNAD